jgi:pilus assembly protein CpaB
MREKHFTGVFVGALVVGVFATFSVYRLVMQRGDEGERDLTVPVVVAVDEIREGAPLVEASVRLKRYPADAVPAGAFESVDSVVGRVVRVQIFPGEPVLEGRLAPTGAGAGLEVKIAEGHRAMSIPVNDYAGIAGLIQPNSRVDVLVTLRPDNRRRDRTAKVFLQNLRVLSVGTHLGRDDKGKPISASTVTVEVTPDQAELLAVAMNEGVLQLALRGFSDDDKVNTGGATSTHVLAEARRIQSRPRPRPRPRPAAKSTTPEPEPEPPPPELPAWLKVQVFRGTQMEERTVESRGDSVDASADGERKASADSSSDSGKKPSS